MSVDPSIMQALLQSGLMQQPQQPQTGLMGALNQALAPYGGTNQAALSLLSNTSGATNPMAALGQGLQNSQQMTIKNQGMQLQNAQAMLQLQQAAQSQQMMNEVMKRWQAQQNQPAGLAPQSGAVPPGAPDAQGSVQTSQAPSQFGAYQDISQIPINGVPPDIYRAMAMRKGNYSPQTEQEIRNYQLQIAQQKAKPQLDALDTLIKSPVDPSTAIKANPVLQQAWQQGARLSGIDPTDFSDPNRVRLGLAAARNSLAGNVNVPPVEPLQRKVEWKDAGDKLVPVYGDTGEPAANIKPIPKRLTPVQQAQGGLTDDAKEFAWQQFKVTHQMPQMGRGGAQQQAEYANYFAMRAKQDGDNGADIAARGQQFKATQGVLKDFESGPTSKTLTGLNTAVGHMDILDQAATALDNSDWRTLNRFKNFFKTEFGNSASTNFNVVKDFAAGEVAKAVLPGGGGEREREEISSAIASANSPKILHDAINKWRELLSSKTDGLRNQWDVGTNGTQGAFDKFLTPATRKALGLADQPASKGLGVGQSQSVGGFTVTRVQ